MNRFGTRGMLMLMSACIALCGAAALAQQPPDTPGTKSPAFDAVSIKPNISGRNGGAWGMNRNEFTARNTPLAFVILDAYFGGARPSVDRIKGAPSWVMTEPYDITAKADDATADSWKGLPQARQVTIAAPMLLTMLQDRCKLVAHTVPTQIQGYALVLGKRPLKLTEYQANEPLPKNYGRFESGAMVAYSEPGTETQPFTSFLNFTMSEFTAFVGGGGAPIIDQTGLTGHYDFRLPRFDPVAPPTPEGGTPAPPARLDAPHLFDWEAVGLELKPIQVPSFDVVIDHIERPSAN